MKDERRRERQNELYVLMNECIDLRFSRLLVGEYKTYRHKIFNNMDPLIFTMLRGRTDCSYAALDIYKSIFICFQKISHCDFSST